jgi:hypothetical protein
MTLAQIEQDIKDEGFLYYECGTRSIYYGVMKKDTTTYSITENQYRKTQKRNCLTHSHSKGIGIVTHYYKIEKQKKSYELGKQEIDPVDFLLKLEEDGADRKRR